MPAKVPDAFANAPWRADAGLRAATVGPLAYQAPERVVVGDSAPQQAHPGFERFANPAGVTRSDQEPLIDVAAGLDTSWDPRPVVVPIDYPREGRVLWISDVHFPYENKRALAIFLQYARDVKPHTIILGGDIYDFFAVSDFDRDPGRAGDFLQREFNAGRAFIEEVCRLTDNVLFLVGNHEFRAYKTLCANPGLYGLHALELSKLAGFPAMVKVYPYLTIVKLGRLHGTHGFFASQNTARTTYTRFQCSMIVGHDHGAGLHINVNPLSHESHAVAVAGTMSDMSQAAWAKHPRWTTSFIDVDMWTDNTGAPAFNIHHRLIVENSLRAEGRTYRA